MAELCRGKHGVKMTYIRLYWTALSQPDRCLRFNAVRYHGKRAPPPNGEPNSFTEHLLNKQAL